MNPSIKELKDRSKIYQDNYYTVSCDDVQKAEWYASWKAMDEAIYIIEKGNPKEYIICACNKYDDGKKHENQPSNVDVGFVVSGRRHKNCFHTFEQIVKLLNFTEASIIANTIVQGFLTNTNRFVTRQEAYKIAFDADQIIGPNKGYANNEIGLTSEDLY